MRMIGDVKCYHCGHISGQVEGNRTVDGMAFHTFNPRPEYKGDPPGPGDRIRCERCQGPVFLEDIRPRPKSPLEIPLPTARKKPAKAPKKAA